LGSIPQPTQSFKCPQEATPHSPAFSTALAGLLRHPFRFLTLWNWKSALLSLFLRAPIFLAASVRQGWQAAIAALLTESVFCVVSAGFYGALVQSLRDAQPLWLTGIFLTVMVPAVFQALEYLLHWFRGTPHLRLAEIVSLIVSGLSALFNWYAMRRGTLLVGRESKSFGTDVTRLPRLILGFLAVLPRRLVAGSRASSSTARDQVQRDSLNRN
jgi:hypothetical protein